MESKAWLIVGLGNPGVKYAETWHNMGAQLVEHLAHRWDVQLKQGRGDFRIGQQVVHGQKISLMIPTSYMNLSGTPVSAWVRYFKINPENLIVLFDDHDLTLGTIRLRERGSAGGHKGMDDIIRKLSTNQIPRLKIGIRLQAEYADLARQVLSKIPASLAGDIDKVINQAADAVECALRSDFKMAMNQYNRKELLDLDHQD